MHSRLLWMTLDNVKEWMCAFDSLIVGLDQMFMQKWLSDWQFPVVRLLVQMW